MFISKVKKNSEFNIRSLYNEQQAVTLFSFCRNDPCSGS